MLVENSQANQQNKQYSDIKMAKLTGCKFEICIDPTLNFNLNFIIIINFHIFQSQCYSEEK